jgi:hypothetical protein
MTTRKTVAKITEKAAAKAARSTKDPIAKTKAAAPQPVAPMVGISSEAQADMFRFAPFGAAADQFGSFLNKGFGEWQAGFKALQSAWRKNEAAIEDAIGIVTSTAKTLGSRSLENAKAQTSAALTHSAALTKAKSLSDVIEMQTAFTRHSIEHLMAQGKAFVDIAQKSADDLARQAKAFAPKAA